MRIDPGLLPYVDQHSTDVDSPPERVWETLTRLAATLSYFAVGASEEPRELTLIGAHRFSRYALIFRLDDLGGDRTRLRAETRAEFPGAKGSVYRALVIGTRIHVLATRGILARVKARAEAA
ncbi:MAG TPA: hypothetical protein VFJ57_15945 [Solirubrobacterales bacterium]|nr:hypothetical protein [Solirubrobacterales bacterium]